MFTQSILHDAIRSHKPYEETAELITANKLDDRDPVTQMSIVQSAVGCPEIFLLAFAKESAENEILKKINHHLAESKNAYVKPSQKSSLTLSEERHFDFSNKILHLLNGSAEHIDSDMLIGLMYWSIKQSDHIAMLSLLKKYLMVKPITKINSADVKDSKAPLLGMHSIEIEEIGKVNLNQLKNDFFGLIEFAAEQQHDAAATLLLEMNQWECRVSDTIHSARGWSLLFKAPQFLKAMKESSFKPVRYFSSVHTLTHNPQYIYSLAKEGDLKALKDLVSNEDSSFSDKDFLLALEQAHHERDFVCLETLIAFFVAEKKLFLIFDFALQKKNRSLLYILMFSCNFFPADLAPIIIEKEKNENLSKAYFEHFIALIHPAEKLGILSRMISQGTYTAHRETRKGLLISSHKKIAKAGNFSSDQWISAYFKLQTQFEFDVSDVKDETTAVAILQKHKKLNSLSVKIYNDALRFGFKLTHPEFTKHLATQHSDSKTTFTPWVDFFKQDVIGKLIKTQYLDSAAQINLANSSRGLSQLSAKAQLDTVTQFLGYLNQCVLNYGMKRRIFDLPCSQQLLLYTYIPLVTAAVVSSVYLAFSVKENNDKMKESGDCGQYVSNGICDYTEYTVPDSCMPFCDDINDIHSVSAGTVVALFFSGGPLIAFQFLFNQRCRFDETTMAIVYRALFEDLSAKSIKIISADLPLRARSLINDLNDPEFKVNETSTVAEFRKELSALRSRLSIFHTQKQKQPLSNAPKDEKTPQCK